MLNRYEPTKEEQEERQALIAGLDEAFAQMFEDAGGEISMRFDEYAEPVNAEPDDKPYYDQFADDEN